MASLTQRPRVWANSGRWWRTEKTGLLYSMGLQGVRYNLVAEQQQYFMYTRKYMDIYYRYTNLNKNKPPPWQGTFYKGYTSKMPCIRAITQHIFWRKMTKSTCLLPWLFPVTNILPTKLTHQGCLTVNSKNLRKSYIICFVKLLIKLI